MIEKLFLAGLIPGIITVAALAIYATIVGGRRKVSRDSFDFKVAISTFWEAKWEVLLPVVLIGGMYTGLMRIHEAAAFAAIYTLIIEIFIYRDVSIRVDLPRVIRESMTLVGAILAILATAIGFTAFLIQERVPMMILDAMETLLTSQLMFLIALNVFLIVVGMLMDIFSAIVVVVPLITPIAERFGVDPYHLGIIFLLNLEIGYMTPPVGLNLFISSFRFGKPVTQLYKAVLPFIGLLLIALMLITYVPWFSTWLPSRFEDGPGAVDLDADDAPADVGDDGIDLKALDGKGELDLDSFDGADEEEQGLDRDSQGDADDEDEGLDLDSFDSADDEEELDLDSLDSAYGEE